MHPWQLHHSYFTPLFEQIARLRKILLDPLAMDFQARDFLKVDFLLGKPSELDDGSDHGLLAGRGGAERAE